jgi:hypothetical protein
VGLYGFEGLCFSMRPGRHLVVMKLSLKERTDTWVALAREVLIQAGRSFETFVFCVVLGVFCARLGPFWWRKSRIG